MLFSLVLGKTLHFSYSIVGYIKELLRVGGDLSVRTFPVVAILHRLGVIYFICCDSQCLWELITPLMATA